MEIDASSLYQWPGLLEVRGSIANEDGRMLFRCDHLAALNPTSLAGALMVGITFPWFRFGPLRATGVLREAADPLGFSAHSEVFQEGTSLALDPELPANGPGFLCMPIPDDLGLFCIPLPSAGLEYGCFCSLHSHAGIRAEAAVSLSQPTPASWGRRWFVTESPFPGGGLMNAAGRLLLDSTGFSLSAAMGASAGERAPPGVFGHLGLTVQAAGICAAVLLAGASNSYRMPAGAESAEIASFSGFIEAAGPRSKLKAGYSMAISRPDFAPGLSLRTREKVSAALTRDFFKDRGRSISGAVEAEKNIRYDAAGRRRETARCEVKARASLGKLETTTGFDSSDTDKVGCFLLWQFSAASCLDIGMEAGLHGLAAGRHTATTVSTIRFHAPGETLTVQTGLLECPLSADASGLMKHFKLEALWTVQTGESGSLQLGSSPWLPGNPP